MNCDKCGEHPATVHFTSIVHGEKTEKHLCAACAKEENLELAQEFDIGKLLSGFMQDNLPTTQRQLTCPRCGMDLRKFRQNGLLGCAACYTAFKGHIEPLLVKIHGHVRHAGKIPARAGGVLHQQREIEQLARQLKEAVTAERFEEAAQLRDRIRELEKEKEAAHG